MAPLFGPVSWTMLGIDAWILHPLVGFSGWNERRSGVKNR